MNPTKTCSKCYKIKPLDEFHNRKDSKDGKMAECKKCHNKRSRNYHQKHKNESKKYMKNYRREHIDKIRQQRGSKSMYENKSCAAYLGIVIAERLCRHLFKDVKVMPRGNTGYDIICNKGKKIDVKAGCITLDRGKPRWAFRIRRNTIADFFICVAFDNRTDLNPLYLWMIPGSEVNNQTKISTSPSTLHKWDKWKRDIKDAQLCCAEMKT